MKHLETRLAAIALVCAGLATPAGAESLAASSASSASAGTSASSGSVSDSFKGSSGSSQGTGATAGDYRVIDVAAVAERPGMARITLLALAAPPQASPLTLDLPLQALERGGVGVGQVVAVQPRPYGLEFARGDTRQAFFLVLDDAWHRDLGAHAVAL